MYGLKCTCIVLDFPIGARHGMHELDTLASLMDSSSISQ